MKKNYQYGLIIGRFQPPCFHHFQFMEEVISFGIQKLLIGVGEATHFDDRNFLTANEVKNLLIPNLNQLKFPYKLVIIPDINNPPKYVNHVKNFFPEIDESNTCLFTENSYTSDCFINYGHNYKFITPTILDNRATNVRQLILSGDPKWQKLVPENVLQYLIKNQKNHD